MTRSGQQVYERAKSLLASREELLDDFREQQEEHRGDVSLGVIPTVTPGLLCQFLGSFREQYPNINIEVKEARTSELAERVVAEDVDFAVMSELSESVTKKWSLYLSLLYNEPLLLAVSEQHPLARAKNEIVSLADIPKQELLLLGEGHCFRDQALEICSLEESAKGFSCEQLSTLQTLVAANLGVAFVPMMFRNFLPLIGVRYLKIKPEPVRAINILKRRGKKLRPPAQLLWNEILALDFGGGKSEK